MFDWRVTHDTWDITCNTWHMANVVVFFVFFWCWYLHTSRESVSHMRNLSSLNWQCPACHWHKSWDAEMPEDALARDAQPGQGCTAWPGMHSLASIQFCVFCQFNGSSCNPPNPSCSISSFWMTSGHTADLESSNCLTSWPLRLLQLEAEFGYIGWTHQSA